MHSDIEVGRDMNGAGPINIEEVMINTVPIMAIGIPFSFLWDIRAQTKVNTDKVAPCNTYINPGKIIFIR